MNTFAIVAHSIGHFVCIMFFGSFKIMLSTKGYNITSITMMNIISTISALQVFIFQLIKPFKFKYSSLVPNDIFITLVGQIGMFSTLMYAPYVESSLMYFVLGIFLITFEIIQHGTILPYSSKIDSIYIFVGHKIAAFIGYSLFIDIGIFYNWNLALTTCAILGIIPILGTIFIYNEPLKVKIHKYILLFVWVCQDIRMILIGRLEVLNHLYTYQYKQENTEFLQHIKNINKLPNIKWIYIFAFLSSSTSFLIHAIKEVIIIKSHLFHEFSAIAHIRRFLLLFGLLGGLLIRKIKKNLPKSSHTYIGTREIILFGSSVLYNLIIIIEILLVYFQVNSIFIHSFNKSLEGIFRGIYMVLIMDIFNNVGSKSDGTIANQMLWGIVQTAKILFSTIAGPLCKYNLYLFICISIGLSSLSLISTYIAIKL